MKLNQNQGLTLQLKDVSVVAVAVVVVDSPTEHNIEHNYEIKSKSRPHPSA